MKSAGAFVASTLAMLVAAPAFSCPPPPPMPPPPPPREGASPADQAAVGAAWLAAQKTLAVERSRQRTSDVQRDLFEGAGSVILARFDRIEETTGSPPRSVLAPVQWLKGEPVAGELTFALTTWATCGPNPMVNGVHGQPGDVFLVYLRGSALLQAETLDTLPVASIVDSQTLARLTQAMMTSPQ